MWQLGRTSVQTLYVENTMQKRQRDSAALNLDGIRTVRARYKQLRFTQVSWSLKSNVSESTLKRLLTGKRIEMTLLKASLRSLGLDVEDLVLVRAEIPIPPAPAGQPPLSPPSNPDFYMYATFTDTNRRQIGYALDHLQDLLEGQTLEITPSDNSVAISGDFPEHLRREVEDVLTHIHALSEKCVVRGDAVLSYS